MCHQYRPVHIQRIYLIHSTNRNHPDHTNTHKHAHPSVSSIRTFNFVQGRTRAWREQQGAVTSARIVLTSLRNDIHIYIYNIYLCVCRYILVYIPYSWCCWHHPNWMKIANLISLTCGYPTNLLPYTGMYEWIINTSMYIYMCVWGYIYTTAVECWWEIILWLIKCQLNIYDFHSN